MARSRRTTVGALVRQLLDDAARSEPRHTLDGRLAAIRRAASFAGPVADVDEMLADIDRGYARNALE